MKHLYIIALIAFVVSCQKKEEEKPPIDRAKTDWAFYGLKGDVKTISTKSWLAKDANFTKGDTRHENSSEHDADLSFDENGKLIREKLWRNGVKTHSEATYEGRDHMIQHIQYVNDKPGAKTEYSWDKKGHNVTITKRNPDNTEIGRDEMKYIKGNLTQKVTYNAQNNPTDKRIYKYDAKGNLISEAIYLRSEYVQFTNKYRYDDQKRMLTEARYDKDNKLVSRTEFEYHGKHLSKKTTFNGAGQEEYSETFNYDANGNLMSQTSYEKAENVTNVEKYTYDSQNNRISWAFQRNNQLLAKAEYKYDNNKNLISSNTSNMAGGSNDSRQYEYEYDSQGNWIKKKVTIKGKPAFIAERTITYY